MISRVKTGIDGLDELVGGGFPVGSCVLVSGKIGTCKSIFAMQYIANGITDYGELGVIVSLERSKKGLYNDGLAFGLHLERLERGDGLQFLGGPISTISRETRKAKAAIEDLLSEVVATVETFGARRLAFERVDLLPLLSREEPDIRLQLSDFKEELDLLGCTSVLTSEIREGSEEVSEVRAEEIVDGVIVLYYEGEGLTRDRALEIRKMRGTEHSNQLHFFDITGDGIAIKKMPEMPRVPKSGKASF
jgi:KaiC/GvpD/RAD55 family RecA-like ATPase